MEKLLNVQDMVSDGRPPRLKDAVNATGDERGLSTTSQGLHDAIRRNPSGFLVADVSQDERKSLRCTSAHTLATWNVRGMNLGKLDIVKREMTRLHIDILGISELHWVGNGYFQSDDFTVFYSGHDEFRRNGVAFIMNKKTSRAVEGFRTINDRIMAIRLCSKPVNISIVQVYAPTTDANEEAVEGFYAEVQKTLNEIPKKDIVYIMGDFNSKVGGQSEADVEGSFGLGERNEAGERLVQFCQENRLRVMNTFFMQPKRRLYTWTSPGGLHRNQIDFILCCHRCRSSVIAATGLERSIYIPLLKKGDYHDCSNYRTIALISHASKILLKIIQERLRPIFEAALHDVQAGFRRGRGTRDHIANLRWIMEKAREHQKNIYICFIDYSKAFDCVEHAKLWQAIYELGVPAHLIKLMQSLYTNQEATVRIIHGDTDWFPIGKGVRQGCILSPFLYNLYAEVIMRKLKLEDSKIGVKIGGRTINNLRFADDTTLLAETEKDLKQLIVKIKAESEKMGLCLNVRKTSIMTTAGSDQTRISIDNEVIQCVQDFIFLGSKIDCDGESAPEIKRRIALGRSTMLGMDKIWKSRDINIKTKQRLIQTIVFPVVMYGCESWTTKRADRRRLDAFELWCWRRLLRIPWTDKVTNAEVLSRIKPDISLEGRMTRLRLTFFGHIMRSDSLEKSTMLGCVSGKRRPGRQRMRWLDTVKADTGMNISQLKEAVLDRSNWRELVYGVAKGRKRLNG